MRGGGESWWRRDRCGRWSRKCVKEIAPCVMPHDAGVLGILRTRLCRRLSEIMPQLIQFGKINPHLGLVNRSISLELGPCVLVNKSLIRTRHTCLFSPARVDKLFRFPRRGHRNGIRRGLRQAQVGRIRQKQPLPLNLHTVAGNGQLTRQIRNAQT